MLIDRRAALPRGTIQWNSVCAAILFCGLLGGLWSVFREHRKCEDLGHRIYTSPLAPRDYLSEMAWQALERNLEASQKAATLAKKDRTDDDSTHAVDSETDVPLAAASLVWSQVQQRYKRLFEGLALSNDKVEMLHSILAQRTLGALPGLPLLTSASTPDDIKAFRADLQDLIEGVVGPAGYENFKSFERDLPLYNLVDQIQRQLIAFNHVLTTDQTASLLFQLRVSGTSHDTETNLSSDKKLASALGTVEARLPTSIVEQLRVTYDPYQLRALQYRIEVQTAEAAVEQSLQTMYAHRPPLQYLKP